MVEMITIRELLRDPTYKKYFMSVPKLPEHYTPDSLPWRLMIQKPGETQWRSKRFGTYREAFDAFKRLLPTIHNAAINCPPLHFMPPVKTVKLKGKTDGKGRPILKTIVWKPAIDAELEKHYWCPFCRRPTVFRMAIAPKRRSKSGHILVASEPSMRCMICGASENIVDLRHPERHQNWDVNRPKVY